MYFIQFKQIQITIQGGNLPPSIFHNMSFFSVICCRVWSSSLYGVTSLWCCSSCAGLAARCAAGQLQRSVNWNQTWQPTASPWWALDLRRQAWRSLRRGDSSKEVRKTIAALQKNTFSIWGTESVVQSHITVGCKCQYTNDATTQPFWLLTQPQMYSSTNDLKKKRS